MDPPVGMVFCETQGLSGVFKALLGFSTGDVAHDIFARYVTICDVDISADAAPAEHNHPVNKIKHLTHVVANKDQRLA